MSHNISRLTLYAVISAIEEDLRQLIHVHLNDQKEPRDLFGVDLYERCLERLKTDFGVVGDHPSLGELLPYLDFSDPYQVLNSNSSLLPLSLSKYIKDVTPLLEKLAPIRKRVMHSRPLNFDDLAVALDAAQDLVKDQEGVWINLQSTLLRLKQEPSFVLGLEIPAHIYATNNNKHNLPIPDFDETGFLGRKQQVDELIKICLGPYPVVTIVGEGGLGKTALALKVAYDILDKSDFPFDAIVWTTSKTTQLTPHEILKIEGAIGDSLGVFQNVATRLAGEGISNPMEEVLSYLAEFRILLIIDNLETVMDDRIKDFLQRLPIGSKVLITSRIGLGSFEYPFKLQAMDESDALQLLRALARVRGVADLVKISNPQLAAYCRRMKNNPGFIKWFVSAVQAGKRPEDVLSNSSMFLEFCMSNVYTYLSEDSRKVLRSMLCLSGRWSQAELAYLNQMEPLDLQRALQQLLTTNMIIMSSLPVGLSYESQYDLSDLARAFLSKHHPVKPDELREFSIRKQDLFKTGEKAKADLGSNPYSFISINVRSRGDLVVAKYLKEALDNSTGKNFDEAAELIAKARSLAPDYYEVHRVDAIVQAKQYNYISARTAYEAAIELEPKSAPLRKWFGSFLMRALDDTEAALEQFKVAARLDPTSFEVQLEFAAANLYLMNFADAQKILEGVLSREDISIWGKRKIYDLQMRIFQRQAEYRFYSERDELGALNSLKQLKEFYTTIPSEILDEQMKTKLKLALPTARSCVRIITNEEGKNQAIGLVAWLRSELNYKNREVIELDRHYGSIVRLPPNRDFGFLRTEDGNEYFFHFSELIDPMDQQLLYVDQPVSFIIGSNKGGECAVNVQTEDN
jgi:cold shock CspA family protein